MTLFEHLRELRYRLIVSMLAILVGMVVALSAARLTMVLAPPVCPETPRSLVLR